MFKGLLRVFFGEPRRDEPREFSHPELGVLRSSSESQYWIAQVPHEGETIYIHIGSRGAEPDEALLKHACDIVDSWGEFKRMVDEFLKSEAVERKGYEAEIAQLRVSATYLFWPDRPDDGMIYFSGPDKYRVWRCDYINRKPKGLGFDD